jgi:hypothetical protein
MYEVKDKANKAKVLAPPAFPKEGRLPGTLRAVGENYGLQTRESDQYKQKKDENGLSQHGKCCQAIHINPFFDGTNNNEPNDTIKLHPTNIARLFHMPTSCAQQAIDESKSVFINSLISTARGIGG